jgi:hypothetical protein
MLRIALLTAVRTNAASNAIASQFSIRAVIIVESSI